MAINHGKNEKNGGISWENENGCGISRNTSLLHVISRDVFTVVYKNVKLSAFFFHLQNPQTVTFCLFVCLKCISIQDILQFNENEFKNR